MVAVALVVAMAGCGEGVKPAGPLLVARDFSFQPAELVVNDGGKVTLLVTNRGKVTHNLSIPSIPTDLDFEPGITRTVIFVVAPSSVPVEFYCRFHKDQAMEGVIRSRG